MRAPKPPLPVLAAAAALAVASLPARGAEPQAVTVEWIFSDAGEDATKMPTFAWTAAGDVLLLDETRPEAERTLERVGGATGRRTAAVDRAAALASLASLAGAGAVPKALGWPDDIDGAGTQAVYTFAGDLYLLDLASSRFSRLTATPEEERVARFSPDGRTVAFVRGSDLFVEDLASRQERRLTRDGSETVLNGALSWVYWEEVFNHGEAGYWWSPDSTAIAFLRSDQSPVSLVTFVDIAPAVPRLVTQRYPKVGTANPTVALGLVDVASGATVFVDGHEAPWEYVLGVTWLPDSRRVALQVTDRAQTRLDLYFADRTTGKPRLVLSDPDPAWVDQQELQFLPDGRFVWSSQRDGFTHLYLYGADGTAIRKLTEGDWSVRGPASFYAEPLDATWVDARRGVVYFTAMAKSVVERQLYRVGLDGAGLARVTGGDGVHAISFSPDRSAYLDTFSARCTPPSLGLHRPDGSAVATLAASRPDLLATFDWQCPELLTVPAADGRPLQVRVIRPRPFDPAKRYPVIVYIYGGPAAPVVKDSFAYSFARNAEFDQLLAHRGYAVVNVDPRSATGASKTDENTVLGKVWSDVELADMLAGVKWIKTQPWVDPARVGVWGWSGGGTSTLLLMTRSAEFAAGIAIAAVTDWHYYDTKFAETFMKTPADNPGGYAHFDLVARAKDLHGRLLLVHGSGDDNVHPQNSFAFENALIEAGKRFDLMIYPMRKHTIDDRPARIDLYNRMLEFWQRNL